MPHRWLGSSSAARAVDSAMLTDCCGDACPQDFKPGGKYGPAKSDAAAAEEVRPCRPS